MTRLQHIGGRILMGWGIVCAGLVVVLIIAVLYQFGPGKVSTKTASGHDVGHVLNWCELGSDRITEVLHSYIAAGSFSGDHLEAHAIQISKITLEELERNESGNGWYRGDHAEGVVGDAIEFVETWLPGKEIPWFIPMEELRTSKVYIYPWSIFYHGTSPNAVKLIFIRPEDKKVFYFAAKF